MRNKLLFHAMGLVAVALTATATSCNVPEYPLCLECDDAGTDAMPDAEVIADAPRHDGCTTDGSELCDGYDDDCDGKIDEGASDEGVACSNAMGECSPGITECRTGELVCVDEDGVEVTTPQPEVCDGLDNDCDGTVDNGNPGAGISCSSNVGECRVGLTECVGGALECAGGTLPTGEMCDGRDNDCDAVTDEDVSTGGSCGTTDVGECVRGTFQCVDGAERCVGAIEPTLEICDALDHDCDGNPLNGYDLDVDTRNCGMCGNVCTTSNAVTQCVAGDCAIAVCSGGYWDVDGSYGNGCEYGPCTKTGENETCNQIDDDCDGVIDENLVPPSICDPDGECAGTVATCTTLGWQCMYPGTVQTDVSGAILPETLCDDLDNDCDGATDESHPRKHVSCNDGGIGLCQGTGEYVCNTLDPLGETVCDITNPPGTPTVEVCNYIDDDCNGTVDEGAATGLIQDWVDIGGGVEMFAYEATRPDATQTDSGVVSDYVCSRPGGLPWTNVTRPRAEEICQDIGARLCTESEWQRACKGLLPGVSPVVQGGAPSYVAFVEAEDYAANTPASNHYWVLDNNVGYSGAGALRAMPNDNTTQTGTAGPRLDYQIEFTTTGPHQVWILGSAANSNDESLHVGLNGIQLVNNMALPIGSWTWGQAATTINVGSTGVHTLNIWMREDGFRIDAIVLTTDPAYTPVQSSPNGCEWSYGTGCNTYAGTTCNGLDYDTDPATAGNQDDVVYSGQRSACYTDWGASGRLFDLSGNVKEWTAPRQPGLNPIRGGSYTSGADGLSCDYNFTIADDAFFFPNVGFRCCR